MKRDDLGTAMRTLTQLFLVFLRLGCTSFGGPIAHLGYFRSEFVERRGWLSNEAYADLVALCQFLPGPASSQVVIGIGLMRGGYGGAVAASLGFTLPSMLLMMALGFGILGAGTELSNAGWIHALKVVAVAVVAQAVWAMGLTLCPDRPRATLALGAAAFLVVWPSPAGQLIAILAGGLVGWRLCSTDVPTRQAPFQIPVRKRTALVLLAVFFGLLGLSLMPDPESVPQALQLFGAMYRSGALVFGGGHVVLPLMESETVRTGWIGQDAFLAGYGAAQALPGPLFTIAAFIGTAAEPRPNGAVGGLIATLGIFLPSFLLVFGALPFWASLRVNRAARAALAGVNAAVVGLLLAALYDPVLTAAIGSGEDVALALVAFALLQLWKVPAWILVLGAGLGAIVVGFV